MAALGALLVLGACAQEPLKPGPLTFGTGEEQTRTLVCVSDLGPDGEFYGGERLQNTTTQPARIISVETSGIENLGVEAPLGRAMTSDDPHFLAVSAEEASDPAFARSLSELEPVDGAVVPGGASLGIVLAMKLDGEKFGEIASLIVTYEMDGQSYRNTSAVGFQGASGECPES